MLKTTLITLGSAVLVVAVYLGFVGGPPSGGSALPVGPRLATATAPRSHDLAGPDTALASPPPPERVRESGRGFVTGPGLEGRALAHGEAGRQVLELIQASAGREVRFVDRQRLVAAISAIERDMRPEDIPFLVEVFREVQDPTFRWALSWLLQRIGDDRMVGPLEELVVVHPDRAVDALSAIGTDSAIERIADIALAHPDAALRRRVIERVGMSTWPDADTFLESAWNNEALTPAERMAAIVTIGHRPIDGALPRVLDVALGPPIPLGDLGDQAASHPSADLRSGAVTAVVRLGDLSALRRLLEAERSAEAHPGLEAMLDQQIHTWQGAEITDLLFNRAIGRGRVGPGEANYLARTCTDRDLPRLERLRALAQDERTRQELDGAIELARRRR